MLFLFTLGGILTWAFLHHLLTPFINATLAILGATLEVMVSFAMLPIALAANRIDTRIRQPIARFKKRHPIPRVINAMFYALLGIGVFMLDHRYNEALFAADETFVLHPMQIGDVKFWVSEIALMIGGSLAGISLLYVVAEILRVLNRLLDHTVAFHITFYR